MQQKADRILDSDGAMAKHFRAYLEENNFKLTAASEAEAVYVAPDGDRLTLRPHGHWTLRSPDGQTATGDTFYDLEFAGRG